MSYIGGMANGLTPARRVVLLASVILACGIDENGLNSGNDASVSDSSIDAAADAANDVVKDVVSELPPSCTTLDVSACVDSGVPDGWAPVIASLGVTTCPTTQDYTVNAYGDNPQPDGGCGCGCTTKGSFTCAGPLAVGQECNCPNCGSNGTVDAGDEAGCYQTGNGHDFSIGTLTAKDLGVGCNATNTSTPGATTGNVTVCVPACAANYCGQTGTYHRCIWSSSENVCPAPFTGPKDTIGLPTDVNVACSCGCVAEKVGNCGGSVNYYPSADCSGTANGTTTLGMCKTTGGTTIGSFYLTPSVPTAICDAGAPPPTASFNSSITLCCLP
jgi:hypothetical protein